MIVKLRLGHWKELDDPQGARVWRDAEVELVGDRELVETILGKLEELDYERV